jgi:hypothetical protein
MRTVAALLLVLAAGCSPGGTPGGTPRATTTAQIGLCASDAARGGTRVLAYGHAIAVGDVRCDSATTGITCRNTRTRHGFTLSRAAYRLF